MLCVIGTLGHAKVHEAQGTFRLSEKYEKDKKRKAFLF